MEIRSVKTYKPKNISESKVFEIIADKLQVDLGSINSLCILTQDLYAEQMDIIELMAALEDAFGVQITLKDARKLASVGDILEFLDNYKQA